MTDFYGMSDVAVAGVIGGRLEQMRLEANIPQKDVARELGISETTYRNAVKGKAKLEVVIGILRLLGKLDNIDSFLPETPFSPIELLRLKGKQRQRAGRRSDIVGDGQGNYHTTDQDAEDW